MWTPPHFWALSVLIKDDYAASVVPMLPVVRGVKSTTTHILVYFVLLLLTTLIPVATGAFGAIYAVSALVLGGLFICCAVQLTRDSEQPGRAADVSLLADLPRALFVAMVVDTIESWTDVAAASSDLLKISPATRCHPDSRTFQGSHEPHTSTAQSSFHDPHRRHRRRRIRRARSSSRSLWVG